MVKIILFGELFLFIALLPGCNKNNPVESPGNNSGKIEVIVNDISYSSEKHYRIPYTLKMWEYENDGYKLEQIVILDAQSKNELFRIKRNELPVIYKDPLPQIPFMVSDKLTHYYMSIQLPISPEETKPSQVFHRFYFKDTVNNTNVMVEGGKFSPKLS